MTRAYIGMGANLGQREATLRAAVEMLRQTTGVQVSGVAAFRETAAVDSPEGSPAFINTVVSVETTLEARALLMRLLEIEKELGRTRTAGVRNAPRVVDLDLLLYGAQVVVEDGVNVPHPRMHLRRFVLEPLAELAPALRHPVLGKRIRELLEGLGAD